jgi:hypothetical protein
VRRKKTGKQSGSGHFSFCATNVLFTHILFALDTPDNDQARKTLNFKKRHNAGAVAA